MTCLVDSDALFSLLHLGLDRNLSGGQNHKDVSSQNIVFQVPLEQPEYLHLGHTL
jgi:hypothetical protein